MLSYATANELLISEVERVWVVVVVVVVASAVFVLLLLGLES
jgi:hypothetical protein